MGEVFLTCVALFSVAGVSAMVYCLVRIMAIMEQQKILLEFMKDEQNDWLMMIHEALMEIRLHQNR